MNNRFLSLLGILLGLGFIAWGILIKGGTSNLKSFLDPASLILVCGSSFAALLINYPLKEIVESFKGIRYLFKKLPFSPQEMVEILVRLAIRARKEGFLSLREERNSAMPPLLDTGLGLVADGTDSETTRKILETYMDSISTSLSIQERIWRDLGVYFPMFGMMGTIIGLVLMLKGLTDPSTIGPAMALALITTFYGLLFAGIFALPIAGKIRKYSEELLHLNELIFEGIMAIQAGDNSQIVEEKLKAHLLKR